MTTTVSATSPRAVIEAAYAVANADAAFVSEAEFEALAEFRAVPVMSDINPALDVLNTVRALKAAVAVEFDRLYSIMMDLPEVESEPAEDVGQNAFAF